MIRPSAMVSLLLIGQQNFRQRLSGSTNPYFVIVRDVEVASLNHGIVHDAFDPGISIHSLHGEIQVTIGYIYY